MSEWQQELTAQVARNIEHHRRALGLKRVDLAARCTALGLPTKRPALVALLSEHRQTITLQELVVLAEALETSVAELIVPLHTGGPMRSGPDRIEHAIDAAERLFALHPEHARPYRPYLSYRHAAARFLRANQRLAEMSHGLATGLFTAHHDDGRPHPASEVLAAEAALSRLYEARDELELHSLRPPPLEGGWTFLTNDALRVELPILDALPNKGREFLPLWVYRLHPERLPVAHRVLA